MWLLHDTAHAEPPHSVCVHICLLRGCQKSMVRGQTTRMRAVPYAPMTEIATCLNPKLLLPVTEAAPMEYSSSTQSIPRHVPQASTPRCDANVESAQGTHLPLTPIRGAEYRHLRMLCVWSPYSQQGALPPHVFCWRPLEGAAGPADTASQEKKAINLSGTGRTHLQGLHEMPCSQRAVCAVSAPSLLDWTRTTAVRNGLWPILRAGPRTASPRASRGG